MASDLLGRKPNEISVQMLTTYQRTYAQYAQVQTVKCKNIVQNLSKQSQTSPNGFNQIHPNVVLFCFVFFSSCGRHRTEKISGLRGGPRSLLRLPKRRRCKMLHNCVTTWREPRRRRTEKKRRWQSMFNSSVVPSQSHGHRSTASTPDWGSGPYKWCLCPTGIVPCQLGQ